MPAAASAAREAAAIIARPLRSLREREEAVRLYRQVFGLAADDPAMTPKLLTALQRNGGSALGAFDPAGRMVGFTYGFVGTEAGATYHYSQAAVVDAGVQGQGVGRILKRAQATDALRDGIATMRWAYDPMLARNAHFNLDVLGAVGRWFVRDYYDLTDAGGRSDRVVVEWRTGGISEGISDADGAEPVAERPFATEDVAHLVGGTEWGEARPVGQTRLLPIPAAWTDLSRTDSARASAVRDRVAAEIESALADGMVLTSCRRISPDTAVYQLTPAGRPTPAEQPTPVEPTPAEQPTLARASAPADGQVR
ncbi:hypothetical protein [Actinopolymorpha pittospori]|uniref:GNAT superfamily acetyltransferase n=1 Tax=Actinopolymorpha pittospori TaxID=648752 RepID=A0A927N2E1_9ACTN|nr:hypothetical protein [Actinopolymorpha pittospori]MBE1611405.1 putative GNAT superfamily acetyltransferase [Actinopolymorpha pittospori]